MSVVEGCLRVIRECDPEFWVVENVRGAIRWFRPLLGPVRQQVGPFFLWGIFPRLRLRLAHRKKESLSSARRAERAMVPWELSDALARACESNLLAMGDWAS